LFKVKRHCEKEYNDFLSDQYFSWDIKQYGNLKSIMLNFLLIHIRWKCVKIYHDATKCILTRRNQSWRDEVMTRRVRDATKSWRVEIKTRRNQLSNIHKVKCLAFLISYYQMFNISRSTDQVKILYGLF